MQSAKRPNSHWQALSRRLDIAHAARPRLREFERAGQRGGKLLHLGGSVRYFRSGQYVPIATGNLNDSLLALVDGKFVNLRVPYPLGFYTKWMDGRIDDPKGGWKGRGLWATTGTRTPFHMEGGKGTRPKVVKFQLRPDPLAK